MADTPDPREAAGVVVTDAELEERELEAGLDALDAPQLRRASTWSRVRENVLPPIVVVAALLIIWQVVFSAGIKPPYVLPSPGMVLDTFGEFWSDGEIRSAVVNSVSRAAIGFTASLVIGTLLGLALAQSRWLRAGLGPIVTGLMSLPSVAWVPAAIIWFGITPATLYTVILLGAVPSIANGLLAGFDQVPPLFVRVGKVLGLGRLEAIRHILLPAALPGYLAGLKQGWAFSWRSLMAAELIAVSAAIGPGLGQLLDLGRQLSDMSLVFMAILLILVVGIVIELLVFAPIERRVLRNRGLAPGGQR
jgi:NitT/TauT family transport system permease protein